jgi:hypothetical protein
MTNLVYLSPVPLSSFAQRPHKFVQWFRERGDRVLWIDPYPTRLPNWGDVKRVKDVPVSPVNALPPGMQLLHPRALPIEPLPASAYINQFFWKNISHAAQRLKEDGPTLLVAGKPSALALGLINEGGYFRTIYDAMDDFPAFYTGLSRRSMASIERKLSKAVDRIMVSSTKLRERSIGQDKTIFVPNACDVDVMPTIESRAREATGEPILGYMGTMGKWFDWHLLVAIAESRPDLPVHLVGPLFTPPPGALPKNVQLFPPCAHETALKIMQTFSVGLIPFKHTRLTTAVDPIKYYEYRSLGLPIISTSFGEMLMHTQHPGVFNVEAHFASTEIARTIKSALSYQMSDADIGAFRHQNSWSQRFSAANLF